MSPEKFGRPAGILLVLLLVNTAYIAAFASPTISCMGNGVLHLALETNQGREEEPRGPGNRHRVV